MTSQKFYLATTSLLNIDRPALNTTMKIDYNAATAVDSTVNETNGEVVRNYSNYRNGTAEGLLFADLANTSISRETRTRSGPRTVRTRRKR